MRVLLVGEDAALLEGLSQSFAALGYSPVVAGSLHDAREAALNGGALLAVVDRNLAGESSSETLAPGGALVLYHGSADVRGSLSMTLQRVVMAELTLPLERNRLVALAQHVQERAKATGRTARRTPPEQRPI
jgi:DNA-binding NtrC family response regulator